MSLSATRTLTGRFERWLPHDRPGTSALIALALAGVIFGGLGESAYYQRGVPAGALARDVVVGWAYLGAGLVALSKRPGSRVGLLLLGVGFTWFIGNLQGTGNPVLFSIGYWFYFLEGAVFAHLILSFPSGRLTSRFERLLVRSLYALVVIGGFAQAITYDPSRYCPECSSAILFVHGEPAEAANALLLYSNEAVFQFVHAVFEGMLAVLFVAVLVVVFKRLRTSTSRTRRAYAPVWLSAVVLAIGTTWGVAEQFGSLSKTTQEALSWISDIGQFAVPLAFLVRLLQLRLATGGVGELVIEIGHMSTLGRLRDLLSRTLKDPSLELAFWFPALGRYVDSDGRPVSLPEQGARNVVTKVERTGHPLAAIIHDPALADERELMEAALAAVQLGLDNERLQAEVRAQLEDVRASRARIVEATDAERRRVERNLHDGAQQRLVSLLLFLRLARKRVRPDGDPHLEAMLTQACEELGCAISELRELGHGIHPVILTDEGLPGAIPWLAERSATPVDMRVIPRRFPPLLEATAYFVVAEALTNIAKYAHASKSTVTVDHTGGALIIEVADDGAGGADPSRGSGLTGLADRIAAVRGRLHIESPRGSGTRIRVELPCE
jgi:signal transduction histidine kinase